MDDIDLLRLTIIPQPIYATRRRGEKGRLPKLLSQMQDLMDRRLEYQLVRIDFIPIMATVLEDIVRRPLVQGKDFGGWWLRSADPENFGHTQQKA